MIAITDRNDGHVHRYAYTRDGQLRELLTRAEAEALRDSLNDALRPLSTAVTPAKARMRPPIMRYPVRASQ